MKFALCFSLLFGFSMVFAQEKPSPPPRPETPIKLVTSEDDSPVSYTLKVMSIIDMKCLGCHSPKGRSDKAKEALMWETLQSADKMDALGTLDEIIEVLDEGKMPPEKMLERMPHMKLTEEETATLKQWAENLVTKIEE